MNKTVLLIISLMLSLTTNPIWAQNQSKAKIALVQLEQLKEQNPDAYIKASLNAIDSAGALQPDLIVLPEAVNYGPGIDLQYEDVAISLESETIKKVQLLAEKYQTYIIYCFIEKNDTDIFNTAALFNRSGELEGVYHKTHEPRAVLESQKITLGDSFPVFKTDFGRIGILICYDTITPEPAQIYSLLGADMIVFPHLISIMGRGDKFAIRTRTRALDACVHIASCGWARPFDEGEPGPVSATCFIDYKGDVVAQADKAKKDIVMVEMDITEPYITENLGVYGKAEWKKVYWEERRPHLYKLLTEDNLNRKNWVDKKNY